MKKAIFLDRDGTIIKEKHYLHQIADVELEKQCIEGLKKLQDAGFIFIIVTNQAGIAKGYFTVDEHEKVKQYLLDLLQENGVFITDYLFCPYHINGTVPEFKLDSYDRKPNPGMLERAIAHFSIDPLQSYMIGDKFIDIQAGQALNIKSILVKTGYGSKELDSATTITTTPDFIASNLLDAAEKIL